MRVLVADQDMEHRVALVSYLQTLGHTVQEALGEREVLDECRKKCPQLIFVDSELSGVSGIELVRQIRLLGGHATWAPIVIISKEWKDEDANKAIEAGADDFLLKPIAQLRILAKSKSAERFQNLKDEVFAVTHNLVVANRALENIATQDTLTGIGNSNSFDDDLERFWFDCKKNNAPLVLMMSNLDYFQAYNQAYGAGKGDEAIKKVAETLRTAMPKGNNSLARISGETFAILLPNTTGEEGLKVSEGLRKAIDDLQIPHINSGSSDHLTSSFGLALAEPGHFTSPWDLKEAADYALFQAKHYGRNRSYLVPAAEAGQKQGAKT
jgi:diguanylate cyclase (GGDEF)-like protein